MKAFSEKVTKIETAMDSIQDTLQGFFESWMQAVPPHSEAQKTPLPSSPGAAQSSRYTPALQATPTTPTTSVASPDMAHVTPSSSKSPLSPKDNNITFSPPPTTFHFNQVKQRSTIFYHRELGWEEDHCRSNQK